MYRGFWNFPVLQRCSLQHCFLSHAVLQFLFIVILIRRTYRRPLVNFALIKKPSRLTILDRYKTDSS